MSSVRYVDASDAELLALTATEPEAFGAFYDRFEPQILAFFVRATRRADLAADLTAEVFAAALIAAEHYQPELGSGRPGSLGSLATSLRTRGSEVGSRTGLVVVWGSSRWR